MHERRIGLKSEQNWEVVKSIQALSPVCIIRGKGLKKKIKKKKKGSDYSAGNIHRRLGRPQWCSLLKYYGQVSSL